MVLVCDGCGGEYTLHGAPLQEMADYSGLRGEFVCVRCGDNVFGGSFYDLDQWLGCNRLCSPCRHWPVRRSGTEKYHKAVISSRQR